MADHLDPSRMARELFLPLEESGVISLATREFPFQSTLSFAPLIDYWKQRSSAAASDIPVLTHGVLQELQKAPELMQPIHDHSVLGRHQGLVRLLMSLVIPPALAEGTCSAVMVPFKFESFFATPDYEKLFGAKDQILKHLASIDHVTLAYGKLLRAYTFIAKTR